MLLFLVFKTTFMLLLEHYFLYLSEDDRIKKKQDTTAPPPGVVESQHFFSQITDRQDRSLAVEQKKQDQDDPRNTLKFDLIRFKEPTKPTNKVIIVFATI